MVDSVLQFYERLAGDYHLIFADWKQEVFRQGKVLDALIRLQMGAAARTVLDCSCGIGTQAIGLAAQGYTVHATDLSPAAVARAREEAAAFGVSLTCDVVDLRALETRVPGVFDVVLSCDNALPHLVQEADLCLAVRQMQTRLRPHGLLLISIRDYDQAVQESLAEDVPAVQSGPGGSAVLGQGKPQATLPRVFDDTEGRRIVFQVWDWAADGRTYTVHHFMVRQDRGEWQTLHYATQYRALLRDELSAILHAAGFSEIRWHMPAASGYYQPIVTARKQG
jgi:SAM-dependent methyltransferase